MKKVYFVRHGESESNAGAARSEPSTPLTKQGLQQAEFIAQRVSKLPIEALVSSTLTRAKETSAIISAATGINPEFSDLFVETRAASQVQGQPRDSEEVVRVTKLFFENFGKPGWRYSDEENFEDLKNRAAQALQLLAEKEEKHILVVTHGFFMRIILAYSIFGENLTPHDCRQFTRAFDMENTGLTILKYDPLREVSPWRVWVWNDHAHLG